MNLICAGLCIGGEVKKTIFEDQKDEPNINKFVSVKEQGIYIQWDSATQTISAEVDSTPLPKFLEYLAGVTGWNIFVEPETKHTVSAKFKSRAIGDGLRLLLGNLSFALLPQTNNAPPKFFVFSTSMDEATQFIQPKRLNPDGSDIKPIPDELIVTLKKGEKPGKLFEELGAKVVRISESLNSYRIKFDNAEAAKRAREILKNNNIVSSVDDNYLFSRPSDITGLVLGYSPTTQIKQKVDNSDGKLLIGLIDTAVQKTGSPIDSFLLPPVSVAGESKPPEDQPTHGTAMAETILRGLAAALDKNPADIQILPLDAYGPNDSTTTFEVALGIQTAIENKVKIINLSLGGSGDSPFLHDVIRRARDEGLIIFAAAGNTPGSGAVYPAAYPEVIAVTAGDRRGNIAQYANDGDFVDIVAPGTSIITFRGQAYLVSGTSASTAFASGLAAGLALEHGTSMENIEKILRQTLAIPKQNLQNQ
ncbi:MAG: S8 family peptidase [Verrucomicrobiia bacterium]